MTTKLPRERESKIQRSGMLVLQRRFPVRLFRRNVGAMTDAAGNHVRFAAKGQSDTYGRVIGSGRAIEIEWKRPGNEPTEKQLAWLKQCHEDGAIAFWADNVATAENVMRVCLSGGRVVWLNECDYDLEEAS